MIEKYIFFLLFLSHISYTNDEQQWQSAIESYNTENYTTATTALLTIKNKNAAVFMLLADCYQRNNQPIIAMMYAKKAFFYASFLQKWRLLEKAYRETHDDHYQIYRSFYDAIYGIILSIPLLLYQLIFLLFLFLLLFFAKRRFFLRLFCIVTLIIVCWCGVLKNAAYQPHGIVLIDAAIKNFPEEDSPVIATVCKGAIVYFLKEKNGFYRLQQPQGWIQIDDLGVILEI